MAYTSVDDPTILFNTILYTGNDASNRGITGVNFAPNWVWIKKRNHAAGGVISDTVRGAGKVLYPSETNAEGSESASFVSFDSDGYTISQDAGVGLNVNSHTYVGWNWKAGTSFTNDASSTGIGTIDSTGSASDTAGFSIVSFTGTGSAGTIKHELSTAPKLVIIKNRQTAGKDWRVGSTMVGFDKYLSLNQSNASASSSSQFNDTAPTSSVFSVGTNGATNESTKNMIAYVFSERKGYSKIGSYLGSGSTSVGGFIHTGFKPAMVILKRTDSAASWLMFDNKRDIDNVVTHRVYANGTDAEDSDTGSAIDFLSNGFKNRSTDSSTNATNGTYIYLAFAESPFTNSSGVPNNAR